jgi:mono/diheme cytochrome c family protein
MRKILFLLSLALPLAAQDGGQLYGLYCSACHGADGKGATGGQFPPLAGSPWPMGNPDRGIKIVLHGLHQPVEVNGKTYNLEMPPQGAALPDDQIAAILTHVRSSWGNKAAAVSVDQVKKVRAATMQRKEHWTAAELLKQHPLENAKPALANLISHHYKGSFTSMPDFSKLKPDAVEEEPSGLIDYSSYAKTDHFAMTWEGDLETPGGKHEFYLDSDDGSRLWVDGKVVAEIKTLGPVGRTVKKGVDLKPGTHKIRLEYFEFTANEGLSVGVKFAKQRSILWLSKEKGSSAVKTWPEIMLKPSADRPVIYRNFIQGTTARGIGVGFPGWINIAYSADHLSAELLWTGDFIDAGHHWTDRGVGYEPPASKKVFALSKVGAFSFASESTTAWPATAEIPVRFRGYQLSPEGNPTFLVDAAKARVLDGYEAVTHPGPAMLRTLRVEGKPTQTISLLVYEGNLQTKQPDRFSAEGLSVTVTGGQFRYSNNTVVLDLTAAQSQLRYNW